MTEPAAWDVYLVTDRAFSKGRPTLEIVEAAVRGGISAVQLREKNLEARAFYEEGLKIRALLRTAGVPLIINDRIDVALALDADGVHLGQSDMPVGVARTVLGPNRIIGLSVEDPSHVNQDAVSYADYLGVSPIFLTGTKTELIRAWELDGLRQVRTLTTLPLVGIGSVKRDNARSVIEAGADCVAVVTAIVAADDPELATRHLVEEVRKGKTKQAATV